MKKERLCLKDYMEISVRKGVREQLQTLAACQNMDLEQVSEELVRRGLETYLAEQAAEADAIMRAKQ
jgi:L-lactate utilization protein LutB